MVATLTNILGAISWNPDIRNMLALMVGISVLVGSVYLIVGSNTGLRTGLLITLAGLFGWLMIMGVIWWMYGIGMQGTPASWKVEEVNYSADDFAGLHDTTNAESRALVNLAELPSPQQILEDNPDFVDEILPPDLAPEDRDARAANITMGQIIEVHPELVDQLDIEGVLDGWELLASSDRQRGDAVATADAFLGPDGRGLFASTADYLVRDAFAIGGKDPLPDDPNRWDRITHELKTMFVQPFHPTHYTVVQVRAVERVEPVPGQAAPIPVIDENAPVISVVMVRDLGDKRFPAFMITIVFGTLFALTCWTLHRRDAVVAARRAAPA